MARGTIKQRIALDGGKEIKAELLELGRVGEIVWSKLQKDALAFMGPDNTAVVKLEEIQKQLETTGAAFKKVGEDIKDIGSGISTYLSAPAAAAGAGIVKVAADFESAMASLRVATQATASEFQSLEDLARKIGKDTAFGPQEAANAMEELAKTGASTQDILNGAADATVKLALANDAQLAPSAKLVADIMNQFGKSTAELPKIVNDVSGAVNKSKLDFDDFRLAIGQVGGVAGGLGLSFEDLNTGLAATASLFASGSDAGTSFKTFIQSLPGISDKATGTIKQLGLEFFDAGGKMKPLGAIADELKVKLASLTDKDRIDKLHDIFGTDAIRTAIGLMKEGSDGLSQMRKEIEAFDSAKAAEVRMQGFNGQLKQLQGSLEELAITIGKAGLLEWATDFVKGLSAFIDKLRETNPEILKWGTVLGGLVAAIGPAIFTIGVMTKGIGSLIVGAGKVSGGFAAAIKAVSDFATGMALLGQTPVGTFQKIGNAVSLLRAGPLALLLGWPALFIVALAGIVEFWPQITEAAVAVKNGIVAGWSGLKDALSKAISGDYSGAWASFVAAAKDANAAIRASGSIGEWIADDLAQGIENTKREWEGLKSYFSGEFEKFKNDLGSIGGAFSAGWKRAFDGFKSDLSELAQFATKVISGDFKGAWELFTKQPLEAIAAVKSGLSGLVTDTSDKAKKIQNALKFGGSLPFGELGSDAKRQANIIEQSLVTAAQDADREMRVAGARMAQALNGIGPAAAKAGDAVETSLIRVFRNGVLAADEVKVAIEKLAEAKGPQEALKAGAEGVVRVWDAVGHKFTEVKVKGQDATRGIQGGIHDLTAAIEGGKPFEPLVTQATDAAGRARSAIKTAAGLMTADIQQALNGAKMSEGALQANADARGGGKFSSLQADATTAFENIKQAAIDTVAAVNAAFSGAGAVATPDAAGAASDAGNGVAAATTGAFSSIITAATTAFTQLQTLATDTVRLITDGFANITVDWTKFTSGADTAWQSLKDKAAETAQAIKDAFEKINIDWSKLTSGLADALAQIKQIGPEATSAASTVQSAASSMVSAFNQVAAAARAAAQAAASIDSSGGGSSDNGASSDAGNGFATGGHVRGRGTSTSDSILSWLSNNEFVIQAKAVRRYGLDFLHALNSGRLKLPGFSGGGSVTPQYKLGVPAFSLGGFAGAIGSSIRNIALPGLRMPSLAMATAATHGRPVNLHIGGEQIPMMASEDSIKRFQQIARRRAMTSAGRKPGWVG